MLKTTTAVEGGEGGVPEGELTLQLQADNDRHMTSDIVNGTVVVDDLKPSLSGEILRLSFCLSSLSSVLFSAIFVCLIYTSILLMSSLSSLSLSSLCLFFFFFFHLSTICLL